MGKTAIVYWSGTGNTEEMAKAIQAGTREAGAKLFSDGLIVENGPTDEDLKACEALGKSFAEACGKE